MRRRFVFASLPALVAVSFLACGGRVEPLVDVPIEDTGSLDGETSTLEDSGVDFDSNPCGEFGCGETGDVPDTNSCGEFGCFDGGFDDTNVPFDTGDIPDVPPFETGVLPDGSFDTGSPFDSGTIFETGPTDSGVLVDSAPFDSGILPDVGVDGGIDGGPFDSGSFDGGVDTGPSDGGVHCGTLTCDPTTEECCAAGLGSFSCLPKGSTCGGIPITCSDGASCGGGLKCCFGGGGTQCLPACNGPQLCSEDSECTPPRTCRPIFGGYSICR